MTQIEIPPPTPRNLLMVAAVICPPDPSNIVTEFKLDSICRFAFI
jgi:hypothetical protein